jgi:hypothetical protein
MQSAETVLDVLRERGRRGLPLDELYRQLFNPQLYLLAYGHIYSNKGAMTPLWTALPSPLVGRCSHDYYGHSVTLGLAPGGSIPRSSLSYVQA